MISCAKCGATVGATGPCRVCKAGVETVAGFRARVRATFPHVKVSVRTVDFSDLARASAKCLTVTGDRPGELARINEWAREAGIVPDGNVRFYKEATT